GPARSDETGSARQLDDRGADDRGAGAVDRDIEPPAVQEGASRADLARRHSATEGRTRAWQGRDEAPADEFDLGVEPEPVALLVRDREAGLPVLRFDGELVRLPAVAGEI